MDILPTLIDYVLHVDTHLAALVDRFGTLTYGLLFLVLFCETGLIITPFLPGDSLLFAAGALAGIGILHIGWLAPLLFVAVLLGDNVNYWIGRGLAPHIFVGGTHRWLKKEYLNRTHKFFEKYGRKAIILGRFVPFVRTFTPFVAGLGRMTYHTYVIFDLIGATLWVGLFTLGGYFFGGLTVVKDNFSFVVLGIIAVSLLPFLVEFVRVRRHRTSAPPIQ